MQTQIEDPYRIVAGVPGPGAGVRARVGGWKIQSLIEALLSESKSATKNVSTLLKFSSDLRSQRQQVSKYDLLLKLKKTTIQSKRSYFLEITQLWRYNDVNCIYSMVLFGKIYETVCLRIQRKHIINKPITDNRKVTKDLRITASGKRIGESK